MSDLVACPCGLSEPYAQCCGQYHRGAQAAPTAESLMRSRFSAFAVRDEGYLLRTWHPGTRPRRVDLADEPRWTRLTVLGTSGGGLFDQRGTVEFQARYTLDGQPGVLRENSEFTRYDGAWMYVGPVPS